MRAIIGGKRWRRVTATEKQTSSPRLGWKAALTLTAMLLGGCAGGSMTTPEATGDKEFVQVIEAQKATPKARIVLTHGLNNTHKTLLPLARTLSQSGYEVHLPLLKGHRPESPAHESSLTEWKEQLFDIITDLRGRGPEPVIGAGFSMGGLTTLAQQCEGSGSVDGLLLFAPAVQITPAHLLVYPLLPLEPLSLPIPTLIPGKYRAHRYTSITTYAQLLRARQAVLSPKFTRPCFSLPAALYLHRHDELVPYRRSEAWFRRTWKGPLEIQALEYSTNSLSHFFLIEEELSSGEWVQFQESVKGSLDRLLEQILTV